MDYRIERDSMGEVKVPINKYWGAQTQRSLECFDIGSEKFDPFFIYCISLIKLSCAMANNQLCPERLTDEKFKYISMVYEEILKGALSEHFPLSVWQTGSGTQTNMNVNEVFANRGNELAGKALLHPNDDINMSQSSNDVFPSAMYVCAVLDISENLIPEIEDLISCLKTLEKKYKSTIKSGRTHLQDATPITFGQEISGWRASLECDLEQIEASLKPLQSIALGGTAVGTGLNTPVGFDEIACEYLSKLSGVEFKPSKNKFHSLSSKGELVFAHGALKALACDLMKIANDIRWLASGPRCGLGEITIPENEPGSSIMPGKVNPTQCEAITMVATQVMGNDATIGICASQGNFELNVFMPVMIYNFMQSVSLLWSGIYSFRENCVKGVFANEKKMKENLDKSLMLVTALTPHIGYQRGAEIAKLAYKNGITLKEACLKLGYLSEEDFDKYFKPEDMV